MIPTSVAGGAPIYMRLEKHVDIGKPVRHIEVLPVPEEEPIAVPVPDREEVSQ